MVKVTITVEGPKGKETKVVEIPDNAEGRELIKYGGKVVKAFWEALKKVK